MKAHELRKVADDYKERKIENYKPRLEQIFDEAMQLAQQGLYSYKFSMWISSGDYKVIEKYLKNEGFNVKVLDCSYCEDNEWSAIIEINW